ncbi:MAG: Coenzyme F420 hydrogenase/dehydrogenase, beta subunit C-terminal domain [Methanospirillum sp.]|nr:Coenzyme F420 hydrogenase/dehydrogenase, beta subunit C-terminal domain [Methanospirillum sp.]
MEQKKTFTSLKDEVWDEGTCSGCGACVAVCPADSLYFSDEPGISHPDTAGYCKQENDKVPCGACYEVCPRTRPSQKELLGTYLSISGARATTEIAHRQSGGAVTAILADAFALGMIDGVITVSEDRWTHRPFSLLITSAGEMLEHAGSRYNWSVPVLKSLKTAVIDKKLSRLAIIGTPCVVQAAHLMKESSHDLVKPFGKAIRLVVGLFCTESFNYYPLMDEILRQQKKIASYEIVKMDVKGKLELTLGDGTMTSLPLKEIEPAIRTGCHTCTDFSALQSDLSAGSVGTPDGWTTLIIRTREGSRFVQNAVQSEKIELTDEINTDAITRLAQKKLSR